MIPESLKEREVELSKTGVSPAPAGGELQWVQQSLSGVKACQWRQYLLSIPKKRVARVQCA